jgi:hypothetical protein
MARKPGRPERDPEIALATGARIRAQILCLKMNASQLAKQLKCSPVLISQWSHGRQMPSEAWRGKLARALYWTVADLCDPTNQPAIELAGNGRDDIVLDQHLDDALNKIVGTDWLSLEHLPSSSLSRATEICGEVLCAVRSLRTGLELRGSTKTLEKIIGIAYQAHTGGCKSARELEFDARDRWVHCVTFTCSKTQIKGATEGHLHRMLYLATRDEPIKALLVRYYVRLADVLMISGADHEARQMLQHALDGGQIGSLSYPAMRNLAVLAGKLDESRSSFEHAAKIYKKGMDSGRYPPHEIAHIWTAIAIGELNFSRRIESRKYGDNSLKSYEQAIQEAAMATRYTGEHLEFDLRTQRLRLTFAKAGMYSQGFKLDALELATNLRKSAEKSGNVRIATEMDDFLSGKH